jgi:hypothetical protein
MERAVAAFAGSPNGGLIMTASLMAISHQDLIITLAARYKLPVVYPHRHIVIAVGLISYGADYTHIGVRRVMSIASSRAGNPPTCRCKHRPSTSC